MYLSTYLSVYISIYLPIYLSIYLSTHWSIYQYVLSVCPSFYVSVYLSIYLFCLSGYPSSLGFEHCCSDDVLTRGLVAAEEFSSGSGLRTFWVVHTRKKLMVVIIIRIPELGF